MVADEHMVWCVLYQPICPAAVVAGEIVMIFSAIQRRGLFDDEVDGQLWWENYSTVMAVAGKSRGFVILSR